MIAFTHLFFALCIAYILRLPRTPVLIASILPDIDILLNQEFPLSHRGIVHTPVFMFASMFVIYFMYRNSNASLGFGAGFLSHLFLDTINPTGIAWFYPISSVFISFNLAHYGNVFANTGIILLSGAVIVLSEHRRKFHLSKFLLLTVLIAGTIFISSLSGILADGASAVWKEEKYENYTVSELMKELPVNKYVSVSGRVSRILNDYVSKKGYEYQQFYITDGEQEIMVFCSKYKGSIEISKGDEVFVNGRFQKYYNKYEIYTECKNIKVLSGTK